MFRNDEQMHRALTVLLSMLPRLRGLWTETGPSEQVFRPIENTSEPLDRAEQALLRAALDIWNGRGGALFTDAWHALDSATRIALGSLMAAEAQGGIEVDAWIERHRPASAVPERNSD